MTSANQNHAARPLMSENRVGLIGALLSVVGPLSMSLFTPVPSTRSPLAEMTKRPSLRTTISGSE